MPITGPSAGDAITDTWTDAITQVANRTQAGCNALAVTSGTNTTTSATYVDLAGTGAVTSFSFTKAAAATRIKVTVHASFSAVTNNCAAKFGVRINSVDYDVAQGAPVASGQPKTVSGVAFVSSVAAGTYTVQGRWLRAAGSGTCTRSADNDWLTITAEEVN